MSAVHILFPTKAFEWTPHAPRTAHPSISKHDIGKNKATCHGFAWGVALSKAANEGIIGVLSGGQGQLSLRQCCGAIGGRRRSPSGDLVHTAGQTLQIDCSVTIFLSAIHGKTLSAGWLGREVGPESAPGPAPDPPSTLVKHLRGLRPVVSHVMSLPPCLIFLFLRIPSM